MGASIRKASRISEASVTPVFALVQARYRQCDDRQRGRDAACRLCDGQFGQGLQMIDDAQEPANGVELFGQGGIARHVRRGERGKVGNILKQAKERGPEILPLRFRQGRDGEAQMAVG